MRRPHPPFRSKPLKGNAQPKRTVAVILKTQNEAEEKSTDGGDVAPLTSRPRAGLRSVGNAAGR